MPPIKTLYDYQWLLYDTVQDTLAHAEENMDEGERLLKQLAAMYPEPTYKEMYEAMPYDDYDLYKDDDDDEDSHETIQCRNCGEPIAKRGVILGSPIQPFKGVEMRRSLNLADTKYLHCPACDTWHADYPAYARPAHIDAAERHARRMKLTAHEEQQRSANAPTFHATNAPFAAKKLPGLDFANALNPLEKAEQQHADNIRLNVRFSDVVRRDPQFGLRYGWMMNQPDPRATLEKSLPDGASRDYILSAEDEEAE